ncbi:unnamed protein product [Caenorhabditis bovis]|uniref:GLTSCR protein conserved domain-containing protein n=1 Tax=Caenorhabditis bovis TaxID=2654633 RepID=A0A8S1EW38_9PELO|nr:unnamed protein product [Caenorhabditis bovis]
MAYNDDDWLNYPLNELKSDSPSFYDPSIENIPLNDDPGGSPNYNNDLSVPIEDFQFPNDLAISPSGNSSYQNMHMMQNTNNYDQMQASTSMEYNAFEQPTIVQVNGNSLDVDPFAEMSNLDQTDNSNYYQTQPSTSAQADHHQQQQMQMMDNGQQYVTHDQQHLMQMQPSTSYMPQVDQMQQQITDQHGMVIQQQHTPQQQQQQPLQQEQPQEKLTPAKKGAATKAANRKKASNCIGVVVPKMNKIAQQQPQQQQQQQQRVQQEPTQAIAETRIPPEESIRLAQIMSEMTRLRAESSSTNVDNTARLEKLESEFSAIFAKNLSQSAGNDAILSQIQNLAASTSRPQTVSVQQPQQHQQQSQPQPTTAPKRPPAKRNRNQNNSNQTTVLQTPQMPQKVLMDPPQTSIVVPPGSRFVTESQSPSTSYNQVVYAVPSQQTQTQQIAIQTIPSTSQTQFIDYQTNQQQQQPQTQIVQIISTNQQQSQQQKIVPSMNSRTSVYRSQAVYQQASSSPLQQQRVQTPQMVQNSPQNQQQFQTQTTYIQNQSTTLLQQVNSPQIITITQQPQSQQQALNHINTSQINQNQTLGEVLKQQNQQLRLGNATPTIRQHLASQNALTTNGRKKTNAQRRNSIQQQQQQQQQPVQQQTITVQNQMTVADLASLTNAPVNSIKITSENVHKYPLPIGTVIHIVNAGNDLDPERISQLALQQQQQQQPQKLQQYQMQQEPQMQIQQQQQHIISQQQPQLIQQPQQSLSQVPTPQQQQRSMMTPLRNQFDMSAHPSPASHNTPQMVPIDAIVYNDTGAPVVDSQSRNPSPIKVHEIRQQTQEELEEIAEQKRRERETRVAAYMNAQSRKLLKIDTRTPFRGMRDVVERMLPFHQFWTPNYTDTVYEEFDNNWMRFGMDLGDRVTELQNKIRTTCLRNTIRTSEDSEKNLILFLESEYERRALEADRQAAEENVGEFVGSSKLLPAIQSGLVDVELMKENAPKTPEHMKEEAETEGEERRGLLKEYEYKDFDEKAPKPSPYVTPVMSPTHDHEEFYIQPMVAVSTFEVPNIPDIPDPEDEMFKRGDYVEDEEDIRAQLERQYADDDDDDDDELDDDEKDVAAAFEQDEEEETFEEFLTRPSSNNSPMPDIAAIYAMKTPSERPPNRGFWRNSDSPPSRESSQSPEDEYLFRFPILQGIENDKRDVEDDEGEDEDEEEQDEEKYLDDVDEEHERNRIVEEKEEHVKEKRREINDDDVEDDAFSSDSSSDSDSDSLSSSDSERSSSSSGSASPELGVDDDREVMPKKPINNKMDEVLKNLKNEISDEEEEFGAANFSALKKIRGLTAPMKNGQNPMIVVTSAKTRRVAPISPLSDDSTNSGKPSPRKMKLKTTGNVADFGSSPSVPDISTMLKKKRGKKSNEEKREFAETASSTAVARSSFETPPIRRNGEFAHRLAKVYTEDSGKLLLKFRRLTDEMRSSVTPNPLLTPTNQSRILLKINRSADGGCSLKIITKDSSRKETASMSTPRKARKVHCERSSTSFNPGKSVTNKQEEEREKKRENGSTKTYTKWNDKSKSASTDKKKKSIENEKKKSNSSNSIKMNSEPRSGTTPKSNSGNTPKAVNTSKTSMTFTNRFNPFTHNSTNQSSSATSLTTPVSTPKPSSSATVPDVKSNDTMKPSLFPVNSVSSSVSRVPGQKRKISALLPWMTEDSPEKKNKKVVTPKPATPKVETPLPAPPVVTKPMLVPKVEELDSPRASSSMSFTSFFGENGAVVNGVFSPNNQPEQPLPAVDFSDDEADSEMQHAELDLATSRLLAMSTSQPTTSSLWDEAS